MPNPIQVPQSFIAGTQVPQTFPELLQLYKAKEEDANINLAVADDPRTRPGLEIRKNGAIQALPGLKAELLRMVEQSAGAIFVSGESESIDSFIAQVQDLTEGGVVVVSANDMYNYLATGVERGLRHDRRFSMDTLNAWVDTAMKLLDTLQVDGIPAPNLTANLNKVFPDTASVAKLMRDALNGMKSANGVAVGDGLNAIYLQQKAAEEAIKESVATRLLPVIVLDATEDEVNGDLFKTLFFGRNVVFTAKGEVSETAAKQVLNKLKTVHPKSRGSRQNQKAQ